MKSNTLKYMGGDLFVKTNIDNLLDRLYKQAAMYDRIDGGTGYGYDLDAANIKEAANLIKAYRKCWRRLKRSIPVRCEATYSIHLGVTRLIAEELLNDMDKMEQSTLKIVQDEEDEQSSV